MLTRRIIVFERAVANLMPYRPVSDISTRPVMSASDFLQAETLIRSTPPPHHGERTAPIRAQRSKDARWWGD